MKNDGSLPMPKPQGAIAALFVGMLTVDSPGSLQLATYRPRLIDTGKLDSLSPPWTRLSQKVESASSRSTRSASKLSELVEKFAMHYAQEALTEMGIQGRAAVAVQRVSSPGHPGQIGVACGMRIQGGENESIDGVSMSPEEMASHWGKLFFSKARAQLSKRKDLQTGWDDAPEGSSQAAMREALGLSLGVDDREALATWPQALLALEEERQIKGAVVSKGSRRRVLPEAPSAKKRL